VDNRGGSLDRVLATKEESSVVELGFQVTSRELAALESAARIAGLTIGQMMRHVILRIPRPAREEADAPLNSIRSL
jgi:hypothetical protein